MGGSSGETGESETLHPGDFIYIYVYMYIYITFKNTQRILQNVMSSSCTLDIG